MYLWNIKKKFFFVFLYFVYLFLFCGAGDGIQGLTQAREVLYHWTTFLAPLYLLLRFYNYRFQKVRNTKYK
jgi:hypothetical protein